MNALVPSLKQFLELAARSPGAAVSILALILFGFVAYAASAACKGQNHVGFNAFVRLCIVVVIAGLVVVIST